MPNAVKKAQRLLRRRKLQGDVILGNLRDLGTPEDLISVKRFDLVLVANTLQYLGQDAERCLTRLKERVRSGGVLGMSNVGRDPGEHPRGDSNQWRPTLDELRRHFAEWVILETSYVWQRHPNPATYVTLIARRPRAATPKKRVKSGSEVTRESRRVAGGLTRLTGEWLLNALANDQIQRGEKVNTKNPTILVPVDLEDAQIALDEGFSCRLLRLKGESKVGTAKQIDPEAVASNETDSQALISAVRLYAGTPKHRLLIQGQPGRCFTMGMPPYVMLFSPSGSEEPDVHFLPRSARDVVAREV